LLSLVCSSTKVGGCSSSDCIPRFSTRHTISHSNAKMTIAYHSFSPKRATKNLSPIFCLWQNLLEPTEARRLHLRTASGSEWNPPQMSVNGHPGAHIVRRCTAYAKARAEWHTWCLYI
jgi:hypothetical protein